MDQSSTISSPSSPRTRLCRSSPQPLSILGVLLGCHLWGRQCLSGTAGRVDRFRLCSGGGDLDKIVIRVIFTVTRSWKINIVQTIGSSSAISG